MKRIILSKGNNKRITQFSHQSIVKQTCGIYIYRIKRQVLEMNIVAIIQARMGSTRLPGKTMMKILGKPMLWYSVARAKAAKSISRVVVATTTEERDRPIFDYCTKNGIDCYRGSEQDVLDRYYQAAKIFKADTIVRVTSDCPLVDPNVIDLALKGLNGGKYDYVKTGKSWPNGIGTVEIAGFGVLERAWRDAKLPGEREHVMPYIYTHPELFKIKTIDYKKDCSGIVLSVDTKPQLEAVAKIIGALGKGGLSFTTADILAYLKKNPAVLKSLEGIGRRGPEQYIRDMKGKGKLR